MYTAYNSIYKITDKGIFEIIGPFGIFEILKIIGTNLNKLQTGQISTYLQFMVFLPLIFIYILINDFITLNLSINTYLILIPFS